MTAADLLLVALGAVAVGAGFRVVRTPHLVRAGLWLVVTLGAVAGSYLVLAAELLAWVQVLLYVGAVVVLLLCAVMLTFAGEGRICGAEKFPAESIVPQALEQAMPLTLQ